MSTHLFFLLFFSSSSPLPLHCFIPKIKVGLRGVSIGIREVGGLNPPSPPCGSAPGCKWMQIDANQHGRQSSRALLGGGEPPPDGWEPALSIMEIRDLEGWRGATMAEVVLVAQQAVEGMGWSAAATELVG